MSPRILFKFAWLASVRGLGFDIEKTISWERELFRGEPSLLRRVQIQGVFFAHFPGHSYLFLSYLPPIRFDNPVVIL